MSKDFNGTTDLINLGSPAALDDIGGVDGPRSAWAWIYPTGWGENNAGYIWVKGAPLTRGWHLILKNDAAPLATFSMRIGAATTSAVAIAAASTLALNTWWFVAASWLGTIGTNAPKLFVGGLSNAVAEVSYDTQSAGSGAQASDAADTAYIGNRGAADRTFDGLIEHFGLADNALSLEQFDALRLRSYAPFHRFATAAGTLINLKGYWWLNESLASVCLDHSGNGNNGTVTGTTVGASAPYLWTRRGAQATIWTPAAPGAAAGGGAHGAMYSRMQRHIHQSWTVPR